MDRRLSAFRLGDVRGINPDEIDTSFATAFAHAFVSHFRISGAIVTGRDMRESSALGDGACLHETEDARA